MKPPIRPTRISKVRLTSIPVQKWLVIVTCKVQYSKAPIEASTQTWRCQTIRDQLCVLMVLRILKPLTQTLRNLKLIMRLQTRSSHLVLLVRVNILAESRLWLQAYTQLRWRKAQCKRSKLSKLALWEAGTLREDTVASQGYNAKHLLKRRWLKCLWQ